MRQSDSTLSRAFFGLLFMLAVLPTFFSVIFGIQYWQAKHWPVITNFKIERVERVDEGKLQVWGEFTKRFELVNSIPMCRYDSMDWWANMPDGGVEQIKWEVVNAPVNANANRQAGHQSFGPWLLDFSAFPEAKTAYAIIDHWCLWVWPTRTRLPTIDLKTLREVASNTALLERP